VPPADFPRLLPRRHAINELSERVVEAKLGRQWQVVLPGVYATDLRPLGDLERCRAALLYAGSAAVLTDAWALRLHGLQFVPEDSFIRVLVPNSVQRSSRQFVVVRRAVHMPEPLVIGDLRVAPVARALCDLALRNPDERGSLAAVAAAVQRGRVTVDALTQEAARAAARGRPRLRRVLEAVGSGIRSAPEDDFRQIVRSSRILPEPLWNPLLRLPDGRECSPDALFEDAGLVHETNGREFHAGADTFEDMQRRNDWLVAAGLTVLHNAPRRLRAEQTVVRSETERCYVRLRGSGLPPGVVILRRGPE
jgi:hypothetical protein